LPNANTFSRPSTNDPVRSVFTWRATLVGKRFISNVATFFSSGRHDSRSQRSIRLPRRASHSRSANSNRNCS